MASFLLKGDKLSFIVKGRYVRFINAGNSLSGKTEVWTVAGRGGDDVDDGELGKVKWFASWRCYSFFPASGTVFEKQCLREIAQFCEELTAKQRNQQ